MKKKHKDFSGFNVLAFLDDYGIGYKSSGKNIANGWIGVESCPFCTGGGFHFGIRLSSNSGNCWICGETGNAVKIISAIADIGIRETYQVIEKYSSETIDWVTLPDSTNSELIYPDGILKRLNKKARNYLINRKYDPDVIEKLFKIKCTASSSTLYVEDREWNFSERLLCPVFINREAQCYVGRDYTGEQEPKYMNSPVVASKMEPHSCIYNFDTLRKKVIFVEGVTDVWRMGAKVGAFLGITFTKKQISLLVQKDITEATVLFDEGADKRAYKLANALTAVIPVVKTAFLEKDDPGNLPQDEAFKIKYQLIGEI
jgi:DNA primase